MLQMQKNQVIRATGLGHPEGPYELDDGRVAFANTYVSEIGYWDPSCNSQGTYAHVGGAPNACVLGSDGKLYITQTSGVGSWRPEVHRPPSIQTVTPEGECETICTSAEGVEFDGPNDLAFGPSGALYFTDSGDWFPETRPHKGRIVRLLPDGEAEILEELDHTFPNGIVVEPDESIVWVESYTRKVIRRRPDGTRQELLTLPDGHIPDGLKIDVNGDFWITTVTSGGIDHVGHNGERKGFLPVGTAILNCVFGRNGKMFCCDMGPFDVTGISMSGTLVEVELGLEGMRLFRGEIG